MVLVRLNLAPDIITLKINYICSVPRFLPEFLSTTC